MTRTQLCSTIAAAVAIFTSCAQRDLRTEPNDLGRGGSGPEEVSSMSLPMIGLKTDTLPASGPMTVDIVMDPKSGTYLIMKSPSSGDWEFKVSRELLACGLCRVSTFWRDTSSSKNLWNAWPGGGIICNPSMWSTKLHSGSSSISYKFVFENSEEWGQTVHAKFKKL